MNRRFYRVILAGLLGFCTTSQLRAQTNSARQSGRQILRFQNGDRLFGNVDSIGQDKSVTWRRDDSFAPIRFSGTNLAEIEFNSGNKLARVGTNICRLTLRNGDSIEGNLFRLNGEEIVLETSFAGKLIFPRTVVASLEPLPRERDPIFVGPEGLEGWTMGRVTAMGAGESGEWKYTNHAFYAALSASIARDVKLPDRARIEFDLAWKGMLQTAVALYTRHLQPINLANKDLEPDFGGFYSLQLNSFMATLMPVKKNEPLKYLGQIGIPALAQKKQAHIEVLADKSRARVALLIDGTLVKEWIDADGFAGSGTGLRFVQQGGQGSLKLSNLKVSEWNGKMAVKETNSFSGSDDLAKLLNGDKVSGKLEGAEGGIFSFSAAGSKLQIPVGRINQIYFSRKTTSSEEGIGGNVRGFLVGGGRMTFRVERWAADSVTVSSKNFGTATFSPTALNRIQLNSSESTKSSATSK